MTLKSAKASKLQFFEKYFKLKIMNKFEIPFNTNRC
jgi:hypothetical protein